MWTLALYTIFGAYSYICYINNYFNTIVDYIVFLIGCTVVIGGLIKLPYVIYEGVEKHKRKSLPLAKDEGNFIELTVGKI